MDGTPLERLCAHRGVAMPALTTAALVDLAPALGMHPADLLAVGCVEIPGGYLPVTDGADARRDLEKIRCARWDVLDGLGRFARGLGSGRQRPDRPSMPAADRGTVGAAVCRLMRVRNTTVAWVAREAALAQSTIGRLTRDGIDGNPAAAVATEFILRVADALGLPHGDFLAIVGRADEITAAMREDDRARPPNPLVALLRDLAPLSLDELRQVAAQAEAAQS
ncbi:hypothetical protein AB0J72_06655 [Dactylosporangium sp. NPDC049742]|uniref:hypothetical protein n=1 Tax=Dactylosporangium sp. NPDC049742 TaxID=3154737 RepID=UPI003442D5B1